jgi:hypothetical protein
MRGDETADHTEQEPQEVSHVITSSAAGRGIPSS